MHGSSREECYPDVRVDSATATNTCGLEVSATQLCGDVYKHTFFDIYGTINVDEHESTEGCLGERYCDDGRYTATKQHLTELQDT